MAQPLGQPLWRVLPLAQQEQALQQLQLEQLLLEQV
jgi:hypothetical protein